MTNIFTFGQRIYRAIQLCFFYDSIKEIVNQTDFTGTRLPILFGCIVYLFVQQKHALQGDVLL